MNARDYAAKLLSVCDRSEKEIRDRLIKKGFGEEEVDEAVEFMKEYGYIDDSRFAIHFARNAALVKKWGAARTRAELMRRGVDREIALNAASEEDEYDVLLGEMKRRFKDINFSDQKEKNRIFGYFMRRGFKAGDILKAMGEEDYTI